MARLNAPRPGSLYSYTPYPFIAAREQSLNLSHVQRLTNSRFYTYMNGAGFSQSLTRHKRQHRHLSGDGFVSASFRRTDMVISRLFQKDQKLSSQRRSLFVSEACAGWGKRRLGILVPKREYFIFWEFHETAYLATSLTVTSLRTFPRFSILLFPSIAASTPFAPSAIAPLHVPLTIL